MNRPVALLAFLAVGLAASVALAQVKRAAPARASGDAALRAAVAKAIPNVAIDSIKPSVIPGYREVAIGGRVVYVSADGKYLVQGSLIELASRDNLTEVSEGALRKVALDAVPRDRRIVFSAPNPKYRVTVFTDIDCGYCRKMHAQIADYVKAGISVEYLFFPRAGLNSESYTKAQNVWCAKDRRKALTDAKADRAVAKATCPNPIGMDYALGLKVGVDGTPAIYAPDGTHLGGYLPPTEMLARLNRQAARAVAAK